MTSSKLDATNKWVTFVRKSQKRHSWVFTSKHFFRRCWKGAFSGILFEEEWKIGSSLIDFWRLQSIDQKWNHEKLYDKWAWFLIYKKILYILGSNLDFKNFIDINQSDHREIHYSPAFQHLSAILILFIFSSPNYHPYFCLMSTKNLQRTFLMCYRIKKESRKGIGKLYYVLRGISTRKKISVPFFFLFLTSKYNFFFGTVSVSFFMLCWLSVCIFFFGND